MATKTIAKLKTEMLFNQDLTRLVDVMKGIAAAQYHVMEHKKTDLARYEKALDELFKAYDFRRSFHPFVRARNNRKLICLVTTDSGFLGGLNMKVAQAGLKVADSDSHFIVLGERGVNFIREYGKECTALPGINPDESRFALVEKTIENIFRPVAKGEFGQVILVYPHAISFTAQRVEGINVIPCPMFFKDKPETVPAKQEQAKQVILESKEKSVIEYLTVIWLRNRLIEIFEDAKTAEYGARTMHLETSFQTLSKINKQLKLDFFKARREKIDQSLRETFTSQLMSKS